MKSSKSPRTRIAIAAGVLIAAVVLAAPLWLAGFGRFLIRSDAPARAQLAVVLAGDYYGHRILKGAELVKQGYAPQVLISGPDGFYGQHECDLAIRFAVAKGYPRDWFIPFPNTARSTRQEAEQILPELRRRNIHSILLVTSDYHTRRAGSIFRAAGGDFEIRVIAAPDEYYAADSWWHSRDAEKIWFFEWTKTLATLIGL